MRGDDVRDIDELTGKIDEPRARRNATERALLASEIENVAREHTPLTP